MSQSSQHDTPRGPGPRAAGFVLLLLSVFQLLTALFGLVDAMTLRIGHCLLLLAAAFLLWAGEANGRGRSPRTAPTGNEDAADRASAPKPRPALPLYLAAGLAVLAFGYVLLRYRAAALAGGQVGTPGLLAAGVCLLLILLAGWRYCRSLTVLAVLFLCYCFFGRFLPGALGHAGFSLRRVLSYFVWGSQGVFGVAVGVSATYLFLFLLFGALLQEGGFGRFIHDLSLRLAGASAGGPAKIAVVSSALLGMVNGSAVANVATTGAFTIPLMKRTGYRPEYAAAVEAAASTGGQLTPPVMGAAAFVLAEFLGVSYGAVALAAVIPAALYYLSLLVSVHLEAKKLGLSGADVSAAPPVGTVLRERGHLLLPPAVLVALLCAGFTPLYAAAAALFACVLAAQVRKSTRRTARDWLRALLEGARSAVPLGVCCAVIGLIIGTVSLTGIGLTLGSLLLRLAQDGSLLLCGLLTMLLCTVLGMGVPGVAAYVIVSAVAAPALIRAGAAPMAAHLFCLFYACLSNITPPVAMSALTAAGLAGADATKTAFLSLRLGFAAYLLPFFFLRDPTLLLGVSGAGGLTVLRAALSAGVGMVCLSAAFEGWLRRPCGVPARLALAAAALCCVDAGLMTDLLGLALLALVFILQSRKKEVHP